LGCLPLQRVRTVPAVWRRHVLTIVVSWKRPCCRFPETGRSVRPVRRRNGVPAARSKRAAPPRSCLPRRHRARECSGRGPGTLPGRGSPDKWPLLVRSAVDGNRLSLLRDGRKPRRPGRRDESCIASLPSFGYGGRAHRTWCAISNDKIARCVNQEESFYLTMKFSPDLLDVCVLTV